MYLYRTTLFKPNITVLGLSASNDADRTDFENNYKSTAAKTDAIIIAETTFISELSFVSFKAKIIVPILWSDVKYLDDSEKYQLNLLSSVAL